MLKLTLLFLISSSLLLASSIDDLKKDLNRAEILTGRGQIKESKQLLRVIVTTEDSRSEALYVRAQASHLLGKNNYAEKLLRKAIHQSRESKYLNALAIVLSAQGKIEHALELNREAREIEPENMDFAFTYCNILAGKDEQKCIFCLEQNLDKYYDRDATYKLAQLYSKSKQPGKAIRILEKSLEKDEYFKRARFALAGLYRSQSKYYLAIEQMNRVAIDLPDNPLARIQLVQLYHTVNDDASIELNRKAIYDLYRRNRYQKSDYCREVIKSKFKTVFVYETILLDEDLSGYRFVVKRDNRVEEQFSIFYEGKQTYMLNEKKKTLLKQGEKPSYEIIRSLALSQIKIE